MGVRAVKYKLGAWVGKCKFGARAVKYKLGARASKYKLGAKSSARTGGQAKRWEPGNTMTLIFKATETSITRGRRISLFLF